MVVLKSSVVVGMGVLTWPPIIDGTAASRKRQGQDCDGGSMGQTHWWSQPNTFAPCPCYSSHLKKCREAGDERSGWHHHPTGCFQKATLFAQAVKFCYGWTSLCLPMFEQKLETQECPFFPQSLPANILSMRNELSAPTHWLVPWQRTSAAAKDRYVLRNSLRTALYICLSGSSFGGEAGSKSALIPLVSCWFLINCAELFGCLLGQEHTILLECSQEFTVS